MIPVRSRREVTIIIIYPDEILYIYTYIIRYIYIMLAIISFYWHYRIDLVILLIFSSGLMMINNAKWYDLPLNSHVWTTMFPDFCLLMWLEVHIDLTLQLHFQRQEPWWQPEFGAPRNGHMEFLKAWISKSIGCIGFKIKMVIQSSMTGMRTGVLWRNGNPHRSNRKFILGEHFSGANYENLGVSWTNSIAIQLCMIHWGLEHYYVMKTRISIVWRWLFQHSPLTHLAPNN